LSDGCPFVQHRPSTQTGSHASAQNGTNGGKPIPTFLQGLRVASWRNSEQRLYFIGDKIHRSAMVTNIGDVRFSTSVILPSYSPFTDDGTGATSTMHHSSRLAVCALYRYASSILLSLLLLRHTVTYNIQVSLRNPRLALRSTSQRQFDPQFPMHMGFRHILGLEFSHQKCYQWSFSF
jgi:hypothetical protein